MTVDLTPDEALVLQDWLSRHNEAEDLPHDEAEQRVLWILEAALERIVSDTFLPNYVELLAMAKKRILAE